MRAFRFPMRNTLQPLIRDLKSEISRRKPRIPGRLLGPGQGTGPGPSHFFDTRLILAASSRTFILEPSARDVAALRPFHVPSSEEHSHGRQGTERQGQEE